MRLAAFDPRTRTLSGLRAFDPRTRSLSGLRAFDPRTRSLSGLRLGCNCAKSVSSLGHARLGRFSRLGDDGDFTDVGWNTQPPPLTGPGITGQIDTTSSPISTTLTAPASNPYAGVISPQQQVAQAAYGTTNLLQLSPAQSAALMNAVPANASAVPSLTSAQILALQQAAVPSVMPAAPNYLLWGGVALAAALLLGKKK